MTRKSTAASAGETKAKAALRVWIRMLTTTNLVEKGVARFLDKNFGTSLPRFDALSALERQREGMTMSDLSKKLLVTNGNTTSLVKHLVEEGLVTRKQSPIDKRTFSVKITPKGLRAFNQMTPPHEAEIANYFAGLNKNDLAQLLVLLAKAENSVRSAAERKGQIAA